jgi:hypothetical protein
MNKKGVELSINVIVITVIALIILVILVFMTSGKLKSFIAGTDSCPPANCKVTADACESQGKAAIPMRCDVNKPKEQKFCCVSVAGK